MFYILHTCIRALRTTHYGTVNSLGSTRHVHSKPETKLSGHYYLLCCCRSKVTPTRVRGISMLTTQNQMKTKKKVYLRLPPALEESPSTEHALLEGPVALLLPQAKERLRRLCPVTDLRLGRVVGRGEKENGPYTFMHHASMPGTAWWCNNKLVSVYMCMCMILWNI